MSKLQDLVSVLKGVQNVMQAGIKLQEKEMRIIWQNSSIKSLTEDINNQIKLKDFKRTDLSGAMTETSERLSAVLVGLKEYTNINNGGNRSKFII